MCDEETPTVVIDCGTGICKAGLAGDDTPSSIFSTIVSKNEEDSTVYIGNEAQNYTYINYPIENGIVTNWDDIEEIWNYIFYSELCVMPENHPILVTQPPFNPKGDKEKIAEIMFEKYNIPAIYEAIQSILSLYASGRHAGVILDVGDGVTSIVPIEGGYAIPEAILRLNMAGRDLTDYLRDTLNKNGYTSIDRKTAQDIKENLCYLSSSNTLPTENSYKLPDGQTITLDENIFQCPEPLFKPNLLNKEGSGIHKMVFDSIMKCGIDLRRTFANNIILSGGTTMLKGMETRLREEIEALAPASMKINLVAKDDRKYLVWIGGSIMGSLSSFRREWISSLEYEEFGVNIVHKKCFSVIS